MIMVSVADRRVSERERETESGRERQLGSGSHLFLTLAHTLFVYAGTPQSGSCQLNCPSSGRALPLLLLLFSPSLSLCPCLCCFLSIFCCANDTCVSDLDLFALSLHTLRRLTRLARILLSFWWPRAATFISLSLSLYILLLYLLQLVLVH